MRLFQICLAFVLLLIGASAIAQETRLDGAIESKLEHNTNYRFTGAKHDSIEVLSLKPSLYLSRSTETVSTNISASFTAYKLSGNEAPDRNDVSLILSRSLKFERDRFQLSASYIKDSTLNSELNTTGFPIGLRDRKSMSLSANWNHDWTERLSNNLSVSATQVGYGDLGERNNYRYYQLGDSLKYILSETDYLTGSLSQSYYELLNSPLRSNTTSLNIAWNHVINEWTSFNLLAGKFSSESIRGNQLYQYCPVEDFNQCRIGNVEPAFRYQTDKTKSYGSIFNASLDYRYNETLNYQFVYSRSINPSGASSLFLTDTYRFNLNKSLDTNLSLGFGVSKLDSSYVGLINGTASKLRQASLNLTWQFMETLNLESGLRLQQRENGPSQNIFYVQLRKNWNEIQSFH